MHERLDGTNTLILMIYQKEPHAGQMAFRDIEQPTTFEERCELAQRMKDEFEMPMTVLVDTMEDQSRALMSDLPSPVYIIGADGMITHKFPWPDQQQIESAIGLENLNRQPLEAGDVEPVPNNDDSTGPVGESPQTDRGR